MVLVYYNNSGGYQHCLTRYVKCCWLWTLTWSQYAHLLHYITSLSDFSPHNVMQLSWKRPVPYPCIGSLTLSATVRVLWITSAYLITAFLYVFSSHVSLPHFTPLTPQILLVILQKRQRHLYGNVVFFLLLPVWQDKGEPALQKLLLAAQE